MTSKVWFWNRPTIADLLLCWVSDQAVYKFVVLVQSDSLNASVDLTDDAKKSPIMQFIYNKTFQRPEHHRLKHVIKADHIWDEGNSITGDLSRGDLQLAIDTCTMLGVKSKELPIPSAFVHLGNECVDHAISLGSP